MNVTRQNVNNVPIQIEEVRQNTAEEQGTYYSKWHLLLNSNVAARGEGDVEKANRIADILKDSVRCVFYEHGAEVFKSLVPGDKFEKPTVESVKVEMAAEIGEKYKRVHLHAVITVVHHTILQIDYRKARDALALCLYERDPNLPFPFIRFKQIPMTGVALEKYIGKHPVMS